MVGCTHMKVCVFSLMEKLNTEIMAYIEVNIDPCEYIDACSEREIQKLISELDDRGYLEQDEETEKFCDLNSLGSFDQNELIEDMCAINDNFYQLSPQDIETIKNIAKRFR